LKKELEKVEQEKLKLSEDLQKTMDFLVDLNAKVDKLEA
jgi:hypothetical protein